MIFPRFFAVILAVGLSISNIGLLAVTDQNAEYYLYLGNELSNFIPIIEELAAFDDQRDSIIHAFKKHITEGFFVAEYDAVVEALEYAQDILERHTTRSSSLPRAKQLRA